MPPPPANARELLRSFLARNFLLSDEPFPYGDHDSLIAKGVIDSTGVLELIDFIEAELGTPVADHEAVNANLDSVDAVLAFLTRKHAQKRAV